MWFFKRYKAIGGATADPILAGVPVLNNIMGTVTDRPRKFSLRDKMPSVQTQQNWDCVGFTGSYIGEYLEKKESRQYTDFSGTALYSLAKEKDGYTGKGTYFHMATYIPTQYGHVLEEDFPSTKYDNDPEIPLPSQNALQRALTYKAKDSVQIIVTADGYPTFKELKDALWKYETPVAVAMYVPENFTPDRQGRIPPAKGGYKYGHAVAMTGFDDDTGYIEIINSWGKFWGDEGYGYIPYGYEPMFAGGWISIDLPNSWRDKQPESFDPVNKERYGKQRDLNSEQRNAIMLQTAIYNAFAATDPARYVAGKNWILYVNACTYGGYSFTDIVNDCYSVSRGKGHVFNFSKPR